MRSLYLKAFALVSLVIFAFPLIASAESLSIFPAAGVFEQGKTFTVRVVASSPSQAINAVSGAISFPADKVKVLSLSKADSILTLWVQEPTFSNSQGIINFEGVVPNPGFTGDQGTLLQITFRVAAQGSAVIKFNSGVMLANDGQGTNVVKDLTGGSYTFVVPKAEPTPAKTVEPTVVETPSPTPAPIIESIKAPIFTQYPKRLEEGTPMKLGGTTYPDAVVLLSLKDSRGQIFTETTQSNGSGEFLYLWPRIVDRGDYELTGIVTYNGVKSLPSDLVNISIIPTPATKLKFAFVDYTSLIIVILICLALILLLIFYFVRSFIHFKRKLWRDASLAERGVHAEFDQLKDAVRKELLVLEEVQSQRELTREESALLEKINRHITRIEKNINKKLGEVRKDLR